MTTKSPNASDGAKNPQVDARQVPPKPRGAPDGTSRLVVVITVMAIIVVLYCARHVLIPLTLAILLSFVLTPLVRRLVKLGIGRTISVISVSTLSLLLVAILGWVMASQTLELAENLPKYRDNIRQKLDSAQSKMHSTLGRASDSLKQINADMSKAGSPPANPPDQAVQRDGQIPTATPSTEGAADPVTPANPIPVEIVEKPEKVLDSIMGSFASLLSPMATIGIVIIFVILILLYREDLRDRVIFLIGTVRLTTTTQALDEGASRVSRYLLMLVVVNSSYGLGVGVGLLILGVPNAILFGVLAGLVRFIPYVGPWVGAVLPIAMSLAVFDSWNRPLTIIGLFIVLELVSNNIIEPWLYGSRTGISTVGVIVAAVFWGWLWGPVGLIMATPLTVCLVVMGRYVPRLEFFSVLLGDGPSLPPEAKVYQRLLAADYDDVFHFTHEYLKANTVTDLYQNVLMPALAMAEHDRQAGRLEEGQDQFIYQSLRDLIEELGDLQKLAVKAATAEPAAAPAVVAGGAMIPAPVDTLGSLAPLTAITEPGPIPGLEPVARPGPIEGLVLCIAARDEADEISALMLVQLLEFQGISARVIVATTLAGELIDEMEALPPRSVCVCAMPPAATSHARYMCKRILARFEDMKVVVAIWNSPDLDRAKERIRTSGTDRVVANFGDAIDMLR